MLNSNENQPRRHKFGLQKDNLYQEFVLTPTPALSMQFNSFLFVSRPAGHQIDPDGSFPTPISDAECTARLFALEEASKESKLIAEYQEILNSDGRLSYRERSIVLYRFDSSAQSVRYLLCTSTVECGV